MMLGIQFMFRNHKLYLTSVIYEHESDFFFFSKKILSSSVLLVLPTSISFKSHVYILLLLCAAHLAHLSSSLFGQQGNYKES